MNSVCIATYNGEKFIEAQLRSILSQLRAEDEVIVSDDGSTDKTLDIIASFDDKRIKVLHSQYHCVRDNFANALQHTRGEIIFLSDQDDVWLEGKYDACIEALRNVDLVCTNSKMTDENMTIVNENFFSLYHSGRGILKNIFNNTYYGSCMAFRRTLLEYALPLPPTKEIGHDVWLGLVAEMIGKTLFIKKPYLLYRRHDGTSTKTTSLLNRSKRPIWKKVWNRIVLLYYVCKFRIQYAR